MTDDEFPDGALVSVNEKNGEWTIRGRGYGDGSLFRVELCDGTDVQFVRKEELTLVRKPSKTGPTSGLYPSGGTFNGH